MKSTAYLLCAILTGTSLLEAEVLDEGFLASIRAEAARKHPSAVAASQRSAAAGQDILALRLWDDPMVGLGFMAADTMMRADQGDLLFGIEQKLPKPGLLDAQRRKATAMHRADVETTRGAALAAGADAARNAIELALADESISLQQTQLQWLTAMAKNAHLMAADPMGSHTDALRMDTELAKEQQMLDSARRTRDGFARKLNLTLGRPLDTPWPALRLPATPPPVPVALAEIARIPHANPKVRSMREMEGAAAAETRMADRDRLPDVSIGIDTRTYAAGEWRSTMVGVKMSLPWFNEGSYQAKVAAARHRELAAGRDVESMRREVAAMVLSATTEAANAAAQARAYAGDVHDKAQQTTMSIEAAWLSSKAPLTDLLDASRILFGIHLEERRMMAMTQAALEELRSLVPPR